METPPILTVHDLSVVFPDNNGGLRALENVSFEVCPQEFICFLGPSGSGKTALLRVLAGILEPTSGQVHFVRSQHPKIGMVFQQANLMPWRTVMDNIKLPLELERMNESKARRRTQEMIELVGLQGFEDNWPRELSGGMAQRASLARALIHDPDLLLLDEPFGSLERPGKVKLDLKVDLPRPRKEDIRYTPHFGKLARKLREAIE